jgi:hypothetical protein
MILIKDCFNQIKLIHPPFLGVVRLLGPFEMVQGQSYFWTLTQQYSLFTLGRYG